MARLALLLVLLVAVVFLTPPLRERVVPHIEPALYPLYEWSAESRVADIRRRIIRDQRLERSIPTEQSFPRFLRSEFGGRNPHLDPWGSPYYIESHRDGIVVGSPGRDRERGTEHDIRSESIPRGRR